MMGGLARSVGDVLEPTLLRRAHAVTVATPAFRVNLLERFDFLKPGQVIVIPNGYDPNDFPESLPEPRSDTLTITYAGTVYRLTTLKYFVEAIRLLHRRSPTLARLLRVQLIGRVVATEENYLKDAEALNIERLGYLEHHEALRRIATSHVTMCSLANMPGNERVYPGKVFELMYLGRRVLSLVVPGALEELMKRHRLGDVVQPDDSEAICAVLTSYLEEFQGGKFEAHTRPVDIEQFSRKHQAAEFAKLFRRLSSPELRS
jgi:glycosyltransferase involved in cell wall biosynthesis